MEMTSRERLLNAILGREVDRVPWSPFLAYYWEHLSPEESACGQLAYMKKLGADPLLRGFTQAYGIEQTACTIREHISGNKKYKVYETKVGSITAVSTYSANANTWFLTTHPLQTEEDFKVMQYLTEHTVVTDQRTEFERENREMGEDGLQLPLLGVHLKTSFQTLVEHWCGTENLIYALEDFPEVVEECLQTMWAKDMETVTLSTQTSADGFLFWEDSSTTNISPTLFQKYTAPQVNAWGKAVHSAGKFLVHHACGHLKDLLPCMAKTEIDVIESISPPPTGNIDLNDAVKLLPERIGLIGGIEPLFFRNCTLEELDDRVRYLLEVMKGKRFILANSDSCPPDVAYEKFCRVSELVRKYR